MISSALWKALSGGRETEEGVIAVVQVGEALGTPSAGTYLTPRTSPRTYFEGRAGGHCGI